MKRFIIYRLLSSLCVASLVLLLTGSAHAVGTYTFCINYRVNYSDQTGLDDYLRSTTTPAYGVYAEVYRSGNFVWGGWATNNKNCTPALPANAGSYTVWASNYLITNNNAQIWSYATSEDAAVDYGYWYPMTITLSGMSSGNATANMTVGSPDPVQNASAVATRFIQDSYTTQRFYPGYYAYIMIAGPGPIVGMENGAYYYPDTDRVFLGGLSDSKYTVAHELGHYTLAHTMGSLSQWVGAYDYSDTTKELCRCDHVDPSANSHCMQSLERLGPAVDEGLAHFTALDVLNRPTDSTAWFAYYKNFCNGSPCTPGSSTVSPPPVPLLVDSVPSKWSYNRCGGFIGAKLEFGVELDWMEFLYAVKNKTADKLTLDEILSVFRAMCECGTDPECRCWITDPNYFNNAYWVSAAVDWTNLSAAKKAYWKSQLAAHGLYP